jgi:hypothetical protein
MPRTSIYLSVHIEFKFEAIPCFDEIGIVQPIRIYLDISDPLSIVTSPAPDGIPLSGDGLTRPGGDTGQ